MRVVIQRVKSSQVTIDGEVVGKIGRGLNLLVGIAETDTAAELDWMARKCLDLRLFPNDEGGRFDQSVQEIEGELLVISQFTLYGDCRKGRRPAFDQAAAPAMAETLYEQFVAKLRASQLRVETGRFGAMMQVTIENDGPVTILLEREAEKRSPSVTEVEIPGSQGSQGGKESRGSKGSRDYGDLSRSENAIHQQPTTNN